MQFKIEQIAIRPADRAGAKEFLAKIGLFNWVEDIARAVGTVRGEIARNEADLSFCYDAEPAKPLELELINYRAGDSNWLDGWRQHETRQNGNAVRHESIVTHIGMHCTLAELAKWKVLMSEESVPIVQEVTTTSHENPAIADKRRYQYCIFGTRDIIGVDLKFIVRLDSQ